MNTLAILQIRTKADIADARSLVEEFTAWAMTLEPGSEKAPTFDNLAVELATLPRGYEPPTGAFLLARREGQALGCVAYRRIEEGTVELKRMYVRSSARGEKLAERLVAALIHQARAQGHRRMVLDSHVSMGAAHHIYRKAGFVPVPAPNDFPAQFRDRVVFMAMDLQG